MTALVVALLRVADPRPTVDPLTGAVHTDLRAATLSDQDAAALEHALRAGALWGCPVLVVAAGGVEIEPILREVLALGAEVCRVPLAGSDVFVDEQAVAEALVAALSGRMPDLVVCGDRSADRGTGAVPAFVAARLGVAQALGLVRLELTTSAVQAERRLDGGRRELLEIVLPAVVSVEAAGVRLRRAPLSAAVSAAQAQIPVAAAVPKITAATDLPVGAASGTGNALRVLRVRSRRPRTRLIAPPAEGPPRVRLLELTGALSSHQPPTVVGPVDAAAAADVLLEFLRRHGYLDRSA